MHIGLIFYSDSVVLAHGNPQTILGRAVANNDFLKALLNHPDHINITIFLSSSAEQQYLEDYLKEQKFSSLPKIVSFQNMMSHLAEYPAQVLHVMDVNLYRGFAIRDQLPHPQPIVTGITHTLGHAPFLDWMAVNLCHGPQKGDAIICTTSTAEKVIQKMRDQLAPAFKNPGDLQTKVIPLGVNVETLSQPGQNFKSEIKATDDTVVFMYFGRLTHRLKTDLEPLLRAYADVKEKSSVSTKLIIAGSTGQETYTSLIAQNIKDFNLEADVTVVANPDDLQKKALFRTANVFMAISDNNQETFGISVIEAFSASLPVIASEWNGYRSLVQNGESGFLIPMLALPENKYIGATSCIQLDSINQMYLSQSVAMDHGILVERMLELAESPERLSQMAACAKVTGAKYDWSVLIPEYLSLWSSLVMESQSKETREFKNKTLDYHKIFDHYPTRLLSDDDEIVPTKLAKKALDGKYNLQIYPGLEDVIQVNGLVLLLGAIQKNIKLSRLILNCQGKMKSDELRYHVMWMIKKGLVTCQASD